MTVTDIYPLTQSQPFVLGPTEEAKVNLILKKSPPMPATRLFGIVLAADTCEPIGGATVKVLDRAYNPIAHTMTNQEGRYAFCNLLLPGAYRFTAGADGYLTAKTKHCVLKNCNTGYIKFELNKTLISDHAAVYGMTRDIRSEAPLTKTFLVLYDWRGDLYLTTKSNGQGQYLLTMVPPGQYDLTASRYGFQDKSVSVVVEKDSILKCDILLEKCAGIPLGIISGLFRYNNHSFSYAIVGLYRIDGTEEILVKLELTNSEGLYLFTGLESGHYIVKSNLGTEEIYQMEFQI